MTVIYVSAVTLPTQLLTHAPHWQSLFKDSCLRSPAKFIRQCSKTCLPFFRTTPLFLFVCCHVMFVMSTFFVNKPPHLEPQHPFQLVVLQKTPMQFIEFQCRITYHALYRTIENGFTAQPVQAYKWTYPTPLTLALLTGKAMAGHHNFPPLISHPPYELISSLNKFLISWLLKKMLWRKC